MCWHHKYIQMIDIKHSVFQNGILPKDNKLEDTSFFQKVTFLYHYTCDYPVFSKPWSPGNHRSAGKKCWKLKLWNSLGYFLETGKHGHTLNPWLQFQCGYYYSSYMSVSLGINIPTTFHSKKPFVLLIFFSWSPIIRFIVREAIQYEIESMIILS